MKLRPILLVEDNLDEAHLTKRALRKSHVLNDIVHVKDGAEALEWLEGTGAYADRDPEETPQVIVLDLKLPKVDGLEVLRKVRAKDRTRLTPVVVLTSSDAQRDMVDSYELGANSYVRKPVEFDAFAQAVAHLGLYWVLVNELPDPVRS